MGGGVIWGGFWGVLGGKKGVPGGGTKNLPSAKGNHCKKVDFELFGWGGLLDIYTDFGGF